MILVTVFSTLRTHLLSMRSVQVIFSISIIVLFSQIVSAQLRTVTCTSKPGERQSCPADTTKGIVLTKSFGEAPCLLGKTYGYDDQNVWVSDGCSGEFIVGPAEVTEEPAPRRKPEHVPNVGFLLYDGE